MAKQQKVLTIKHVDSGHTETLTQEEFDNLKPRVKAMYTVEKTQNVATPQELEKPANS